MGNRRPSMRYTHQRKGASSLPWLLVGIGALVCLTAFTLASLHASPANRSEGTGMSSANNSTAPQSGVQGGIAITPHLNLAANAASTASGEIATLPTFTADDASAWVMSHGLGFYQATGTMTIGSVTFLPYEQADQWLHLAFSLGLPAATPVCVVVLDGSFIDTPPRPGPGGSTTPQTSSYALEVFNGVTGNLLIRELRNSIPAAPTAASTPTTPATPTTGSTPTTPPTPGTGTPTP